MGRENSGKATASKMTTSERKARAMKGVEARKHRASLPKAGYEGEIKIGDNSLDVAVIEGDVRVIRQNAVFDALDRPGRGNARLVNIPTFKESN